MGYSLFLSILATHFICLHTSTTPQTTVYVDEDASKCEVGAVWSEESQQCEECVVSGDENQCYSGTECVYDSDTDTKNCLCSDGYLYLKENENYACGYCSNSTTCHLERTCVQFGYDEYVCAIECDSDDDCEDELSAVCEVPRMMTSRDESQKNVSEYGGICWCKDGYYYTAEGICALKPNRSVEAISCYECSGTACNTPPFYDALECTVNQVCYTHVKIEDWAIKEYDKLSRIMTRPEYTEVKRGCITPSQSMLDRQERIENTTNWQNCEVKDSTIYCYWICDYSYCNWQRSDPMVEVDSENNHAHFWATIAGVVLMLIVLVSVIFVFKFAGDQLQKSKDEYHKENQSRPEEETSEPMGDSFDSMHDYGALSSDY